MLVWDRLIFLVVPLGLRCICINVFNDYIDTLRSSLYYITSLLIISLSPILLKCRRSPDRDHSLSDSTLVADNGYPAILYLLTCDQRPGQAPWAN